LTLHKNLFFIEAVKTTILTVSWCVAGARHKKPFCPTSACRFDLTFAVQRRRFFARSASF